MPESEKKKTLSDYMFQRREINIAEYRSENIRQSFPTEREARKEYSRLRSIAEKRIARLEHVTEEGGYMQREAQVVLDTTGHFDKLKDITGQDIYTQLERVAAFVHSKRSSVSTLREMTREQYREILKKDDVQRMISAIRQSKDEDTFEDEFAAIPDLDFDLEEDDLFEALVSFDLEPAAEDEEQLFNELAVLFDIWDQLRSIGKENKRYDAEAIKTLYNNKGASAEELILMLSEDEYM